MRSEYLLAALMFAAPLCADTAIVIPHQGLQEYGYSQNRLSGICTQGLGAKEIEVWHSSLGPGDHTPLHRHDCEEVFIFLKGHGKVVIGGEEVFYSAPCTLIIPRDVDHEVYNLSDEPTDHYTLLRIGSTIWNGDGEVMRLPWRR